MYEERSFQEADVDHSTSWFKFGEKALGKRLGKTAQGYFWCIAHRSCHGLGTVCVSKALGTVPGTCTICQMEASARVNNGLSV